MNVFATLRTRSALFWVAIGLLGIIGIGIADIATGSELSFSLFYLIPIVLATWFLGRNYGYALCVIGAAIWFASDFLGGKVYSEPYIRYWNAAIRLSFFLLATHLLLSSQALMRERMLARLDALTGAANRRYLFETIQIELDRSHRYKHSFTIAYIDLDNFKIVNDQLGHEIGDQLLCAAVRRLKYHMRKTDMLARLGGDEFILLLPETDHKEAQAIIPKIQSALLNEMKRHNWPVTFSIGVLTCLDAQVTTDELVGKADDLMYSVKKNGKNAIAYAVYEG